MARGELGALAIDRPPLISTVGVAMPREARSVWLTMEIARLLRNVIGALADKGDWIGARTINSERVT